MAGRARQGRNGKLPAAPLAIQGRIAGPAELASRKLKALRRGLTTGHSVWPAGWPIAAISHMATSS